MIRHASMASASAVRARFDEASGLRYQRFRLQIHPAVAGGFMVRTSCQRGEGRAALALPFAPAEAAALAGSDPKLAGEQLFEALLGGENLSLYERCLDLLETDDRTALRLELTFDPRDPDVAALQSLPWELLRRPGTPEVLALDRRRSVVRYLAVPLPVRAAPRPAKLRIVVVAADPRFLAPRPLDLEGELRNLRAAVAKSPEIEIVLPEAQTLAALRRTLATTECHVLHFMGHGGRREGSMEQALFFEAGDGRLDPVSGADLMSKLAGFPSLRLAVLNACESGRVPEASEDAGFHPLAGVATSLVLGGLPAVIAMRQPLSDSAAIAFSRAFYRRLAAGDSVDAAMVEGRHEVHSVNRAGCEWGTPILFLRTATGELYPERDLPPEAAPARRFGRRRLGALAALLLLVALGEAGRRWRVERLVEDGVARFSARQWDEARERFTAARKLAPRSAEIAANLAAAEEKLGEVRAAEDLYREAARLAPEAADRRFDLGVFLNDRGNPVEAFSALSDAIALDPQKPEAWAELARAAADRGLFGRARAAIGVALRLDPERAVYHRRLGEIELAAGRPAAAIPPLEEAHRRYPLGHLGFVETVALLARAEDRVGNGPASCRFVDEFRRLDAAGITPWAPEVETVAERRRCASPARKAGAA